MNFKPTKLNVLTSLVVAIIIGIFLYNTAIITDVGTEQIIAFKLKSSLHGFVISFIIAYITASLFQKKK